MRFQSICVIGLGYIGLPTASTFASRGVQVLGVDVNPRILENLRRGEIHIRETGLEALYHAALRTGKLKVADTPQPSDAFIIAVPTPFYEDRLGEYAGEKFKLSDMRAVSSAAESLVPVLRKGCLVVLESTSPPRTTVDLVAPILEKSGLKPGVDFHLAYSPERVLPGQILSELVENARVVGGVTPESAQAAAALYSIFVTGEIVQTDSTTAELVKLMENTFRDTNIALANEFSRLTTRFGVDIWEAIALANRHPRVKILNPGPGVGGHCISVDPWFLVEGAPELAELVGTARRVNDSQPKFVVELVRRALGSLDSRKICALGLAYKPDVDDLRESPAAEVVRELQHAGARVLAWEPYAGDQKVPGVSLAQDLDSALTNADAILLLVPHTEFRALKPAAIAKQTTARIVVDTVNGCKIDEWTAAGFRVIRLGDGRSAA